MCTGTPQCVQQKGYNFTWRPVRVDDATNLNVVVPANCNAILIENYGTSTALVNGKPFLPNPVAGLPGEKLALNGNDGDKYVGEIVVQFTPGGTNLVWISFMIYTPSL